MKTVVLRSVALALLVGGVLLVLGPNSAKAQVFTTPTGAVDTAGEPVSASATVTVGSGTISVALTDNTGGAALRSVGQALSDFSFTLSTAPGSTSLSTQAGSLIDIGAGGVATPVAGNPTHWKASNPSNNTVLLTTIGNGAPINMIVGDSPPYTNANASLTGGQFNPFISPTGTFTLSVAGATPSSTLSNVNFSFGTAGESVVGVPEPGTLLGAGVVTLMGLGYTRRRRRANA